MVVTIKTSFVRIGELHAAFGGRAAIHREFRNTSVGDVFDFEFVESEVPLAAVVIFPREKGEGKRAGICGVTAAAKSGDLEGAVKVDIAVGLTPGVVNLL